MQLLTGLQFDICHVIKTKLGFEITEIHNFYNLKILRSTSIVKLYVYKTVNCEVINFKLLSRDLSLHNFAIMVKWKCLKLLYLSKGMCKIDSQSKKWIRLKYLILETYYTFFSIFSWYFIVLHTLNFLFPMFSGINNNNFSFFDFSNLSFLDPEPRLEGSYKIGSVLSFLGISSLVF